MKPSYVGTLFDLPSDVGPSTAPPTGEPLVDRSAKPPSIAGSESDDDASAGVDAERSKSTTWVEVPQALFDSWSLPQQLDYCARRDEYSAAHEADNPSWIAFYQHRARRFRQALAETRREAV